MARIDYPDLSALAAPTKELIAGRPLINVLRMWAHSEPLLPLIAQLGATQFAALQLTARDRELTVLAVAHTMWAPYVVDQHEAISESCGVTSAERAALALGPQWELSSTRFSPAERALIRFAIAVLEKPSIPEYYFVGIRKYYTERQIVETITLVGFYFTVGRMTTTLGIESDPSGDTAVLDAGIDLATAR